MLTLLFLRLAFLVLLPAPGQPVPATSQPGHAGRPARTAPPAKKAPSASVVVPTKPVVVPAKPAVPPAESVPPPVAGPGPVAKPVIRHIHATANARQDTVFRLGSTITLEVAGLSQWLHEQEDVLVQRGLTPQQARTQARNLVLYINDAPLIGMPPLAVYANDAPPPGQPAAASTEYDKVVFQLSRTADNDRYWSVVYSSPWAFSHPGRIGLGYDDRVVTELYPGQEGSIRVELIQPSSLWGALLAAAGLGLGMVLLAVRSWLLRNTAGQTTGSGGATVALTNPSYSLAKTQLAWWTFIILSSYLVIYCVTGEMPDLSTTSLALLGISAGTTTLSGLITPAGSEPAAPVSASRGWLTDILSDEHGVSMHRLQKVIISLLMGYFFVRSVYKTVAMPEWTTNETLLLAVSSATYLGLKWQENRPSAGTVTPGGAPVTGPALTSVAPSGASSVPLAAPAGSQAVTPMATPAPDAPGSAAPALGSSPASL